MIKTMRNSKVVIILAFVLGFCVIANAQQSKEAEYLPLTVWVPTQEGLPESAKKNLENRLKQITVANGIGSEVKNGRFILTAQVIEEYKGITSSAPPMNAYSLNITFYIGDGFEGKAFSSYSTTVKGVGENNTKAYMNAIKNIQVKDKNYQAFIEEGKAKIIEYYNTQCELVIKEALSLAAMREYDEALFKLTTVPNSVTNCWQKSMDAATTIYQQMIDFECKAKLAEATNIWNANQSWEGAQNAGVVLSSIDPNSACSTEAQALSEKISKRIAEVDKREWDMKYEKEVGLQRDMIEAVRDIGVSYGKNQPQNVTYKSIF